MDFVPVAFGVRYKIKLLGWFRPSRNRTWYSHRTFGSDRVRRSDPVVLDEPGSEEWLVTLLSSISVRNQAPNRVRAEGGPTDPVQGRPFVPNPADPHRMGVGSGGSVGSRSEGSACLQLPPPLLLLWAVWLDHCFQQHTAPCWTERPLHQRCSRFIVDILSTSPLLFTVILLNLTVHFSGHPGLPSD